LSGQHNINLDNASGFITNNRAIMVLEVPDAARAREVLQKQGFRVLTQKELPCSGRPRPLKLDVECCSREAEFDVKLRGRPVHHRSALRDDGEL